MLIKFQSKRQKYIYASLNCWCLRACPCKVSSVWARDLTWYLEPEWHTRHGKSAWFVVGALKRRPAVLWLMSALEILHHKALSGDSQLHESTSGGFSFVRMGLGPWKDRGNSKEKNSISQQGNPEQAIQCANPHRSPSAHSTPPDGGHLRRHHLHALLPWCSNLVLKIWVAEHVVTWVVFFGSPSTHIQGKDMAKKWLKVQALTLKGGCCNNSLRVPSAVPAPAPTPLPSPPYTQTPKRNTQANALATLHPNYPLVRAW